MQSTKLEQQVVKLDTQARQALSQGREDLTRMALERKTLAQTELQSLDADQGARGSAGAAHRERAEAAPEDRAVRTKKEVIKARYSQLPSAGEVSEAANRVGEQMADLGLAISARRTRPRRCGRARPQSRKLEERARSTT